MPYRTNSSTKVKRHDAIASHRSSVGSSDLCRLTHTDRSNNHESLGRRGATANALRPVLYVEQGGQEISKEHQRRSRPRAIPGAVLDDGIVDHHKSLACRLDDGLEFLISDTSDVIPDEHPARLIRPTRDL